MSSARKPPSINEPDATDDLLAQFAAEKSTVAPGTNGTINTKSPFALANMVFGGPLRLPRKEDDVYEGTLPPPLPPSYATATGWPVSPSRKRTNALGKEIEGGGGIGEWWEKRKEKKAAGKAGKKSSAS